MENGSFTKCSCRPVLRVGFQHDIGHFEKLLSRPLCLRSVLICLDSSKGRSHEVVCFVLRICIREFATATIIIEKSRSTSIYPFALPCLALRTQMRVFTTRGVRGKCLSCFFLDNIMF